MSIDEIVRRDEEEHKRSVVAWNWAKQTMEIPDKRDRHAYFLHIVDQARPRKMYFSHWRAAVYDRLIAEYEDLGDYALPKDHKISIAYFHTYEAILHGMIPAMWDN